MRDRGPRPVNLGRSVNLPAGCFNQYNVPVLPSSSHPIPSGFAQVVARKFGRGPFLVIGAEREELERHFESAKVGTTVLASEALAPQPHLLRLPPDKTK